MEKEQTKEGKKQDRQRQRPHETKREKGRGKRSTAQDATLSQLNQLEHSIQT